MLTFPRAPRVAAGQPIRSRQLNQLAKSLNSRYRAISDLTWRALYSVFGLCRDPINPDASGLRRHSQAEWLKWICHLDPAHASWPAQPPGMPEGANLNSPLMAYVHGNAAADLDSEEGRIASFPLTLPGGLAKPSDFWRLGQFQRGGYHPETGLANTPALDLARAHYRIAYPIQSWHLSNWGGWMPGWPISGVCPDPDPADDYGPPLNFILTFASLKPGLADKTYPGTCQPVPGVKEQQYPDHVRWWGEWPEYYGVLLNDGTFDILPKPDYVKYQRSAGAPMRQPSGILDRVLNQFAREFRGAVGTDVPASPDGGSPSGDPIAPWLSKAFNFDRFAQRQYLLSPAYAISDGRAVAPQYPACSLSAPASTPYRRPAGTILTWRNSAQHVTPHDEFVIAGCCITGTQIAKPVILHFIVGDQVIEARQFDPTDHAIDDVLWFDKPIRAGQRLLVILGAEAKFTSASGRIQVECAELLDYKPRAIDAYVVLRCGGARFDTAVDGRGPEETLARQIGDAYFRYGAVSNARGYPGIPGTLDEVTSNAVFEAARRLARWVRVIPADNIVGYAVETVGGTARSIVWCQRHVLGMSNNAPLDAFGGIAPAREPIPSGQIRTGRVYTIRVASVIYAKRRYQVGAILVGLPGERDYTGNGEVWEAEGIRHDAPPNDWTNEWVMHDQLKPYSWSENSVFKESVFADYFLLNNRCLMGSEAMTSLGNHDLLSQVAYGNPVVAPAEAPSAWNYARGLNTAAYAGEDQVKFYRSCQIYAPAAEIDSATLEFGTNGEQFIKLVFTGRLQHNSAAPATISRDLSEWTDDPGQEALDHGRTTENAIREWLLRRGTGKDCVRGVIGDTAADTGASEAGWWWADDTVRGTCYPDLILCKLIERPYSDTNDVIDRRDTPLWHDVWPHIEFLLRAACESFFDARTSLLYSCDTGILGAWDFTWENLWLQATGNRWLPLLPASVRPDNPEGHGPWPTTQAYADTFNAVAAAIDNLDRLRIELPIAVEMCNKLAIAAYDMDPPPTWSSDASKAAYAWGVSPMPVVPACAPEDWYEGLFDIGSAGSRIMDYAEIGSRYGITIGTAWGWVAERKISRWRIKTDQACLEALPTGIRELLDANFGLIGFVETDRVRTRIDGSKDFECGLTGCTNTLNWNAEFGGSAPEIKQIEPCNQLERISEPTALCLFMTGGELVPADPPVGHHLWWNPGAGRLCFGGSSTTISFVPIANGDTLLGHVQIPLVDQ